jgi:hypothetical protein
MPATPDLTQHPIDQADRTLTREPGFLIRNQEVGGSSPPRSTNRCNWLPAGSVKLFPVG